MVFADLNGRDKSTITGMAKTIGIYINADDIKRATICTDMDAALIAERLSNNAVAEHKDKYFKWNNQFSCMDIINITGIKDF